MVPDTNTLYMTIVAQDDGGSGKSGSKMGGMEQEATHIGEIQISMVRNPFLLVPHNTTSIPALCMTIYVPCSHCSTVAKCWLSAVDQFEHMCSFHKSEVYSV